MWRRAAFRYCPGWSELTEEAIDFTKHAKAAGADGVLHVCPYYNKPTQEGLYLRQGNRRVRGYSGDHLQYPGPVRGRYVERDDGEAFEIAEHCGRQKMRPATWRAH